MEIFTKDQLKIEVHTTRKAMGESAASAIETAMEEIIQRQQSCRMIFAAAPSQNEVLDALVRSERIDWHRVTAFHMDEYIGLEADAQPLFANFLRRAVFDRVPLAAVHYLNGLGDPEQEAERYTQLLLEAPIDLVIMGVGENGHVAFNDPPVADFGDKHMVKVVELEQACRQQQVNDGCFEQLEDVPTHALTLTVPMLMRSKQAFCIVPGPTKAQAIQDMLDGPIDEACPASILRTHPNSILYLDVDSAKKWQAQS